MFAALYRRLIALAESPSAPYVLFAVAFTESWVFPIPPDVLLAPMTIARPQRAWAYAILCTLASVLGGMVGYAIGAWLYDTVGLWLIHLYGLGAKVAEVKAFYDRWGALLIVIKGFFPIPFKLVTIVSGLLGYNFPMFVLLSLLTRGARFFVVAGALNYFGESLRGPLERHFAAFIVLSVLLVVAGFWLAAHVL